MYSNIKLIFSFKYTNRVLVGCSPSIYDVHMEGEGESGSCGRGGQAPWGRPHRKLKLEFTGVILSSSHAKKLASFFYQNFVFGRNKKWKFFGNIN